MCCSVSRCVAGCCSVSPCVAVCCSRNTSTCAAHTMSRLPEMSHKTPITIGLVFFTRDRLSESFFFCLFACMYCAIVCAMNRLPQISQKSTTERGLVVQETPTLFIYLYICLSIYIHMYLFHLYMYVCIYIHTCSCVALVYSTQICIYLSYPSIYLSDVVVCIYLSI